MTLRTKRLVLTPLSDAVLKEKMERETCPHDRAAYAQMLDGCTAHPKERLFYTAWEISTKDGDAVGDACFKGAPVCGEVEIGCGIGEAYRKQGYAAEAARALIDWAFGQEDVYFIMAECEEENPASARVLEKLGFAAAGDGAEGKRFELEKPATAWMVIFMSLGMSVGMCLGVASDNHSLGMCLGLPIGMAIGMALDAADKKKRQTLKKARADRQ